MKNLIYIIFSTLILAITAIACVGSYHAHNYSMDVMPPEVVPERIVKIEYVEVQPNIIEIPEEEKIPADLEFAEECIEEEFLNLTYEDMDLLERVAMAEAEGEDSIGKALVMLTVLNRSAERGLPIGEVIYAPSQYCVSRMGIDPTDDCHEALAMVMDGWNETMLETEEEWDRTKRIFYFGADGYPAYGEPAFHYGGHWFSVR